MSNDTPKRTKRFRSTGGNQIDVVGEFKIAYSERYNRLSVSLTPNYELRTTTYELRNHVPPAITLSSYGFASNVLILEVKIAINSLHSS